ncbi:MAG: xanthine dehydrogenase family protein molybdopterin-binding subunit [Rhodospirillales bacterium]
MGQFGIGQSVRRKEDERFLRGHGRYVADLSVPGHASLCFVRSPHAHARLLAVDTAAAAARPGVIAVLTASDYAADGLGLPGTDFMQIAGGKFRFRAGTTVRLPPNAVMAADRVRHVGEPVAVVVAETEAAAAEAAERVAVDYAPLPAVADAAAALAGGAPVWDDIPDNLCVDAEYGDEAACAAAFGAGAHVASVTVVNNRIAVTPMEPRAVIAEYDAARDAYLIHTNSQTPHRVRHALAHEILRVPDAQVRLVSPDVGGGFGGRSAVYPEIVVAAWCARRFRRPMRWIGERGECFLTDTQGRDNRSRAEAAFDADGRMLALRVDTIANMGAYPGHLGPAVPVVLGPRVQNGVYDIPLVYARVRAAYTNTMTVSPYRGAGQPESVYLIERLMDAAAAAIGIDPVALRRRNHIAAAAMPFRTATGVVYDSGDYAANLDAALALADWDGFAARATASRARGVLRGRGLANYIQVAAGVPMEWGALHVRGDGTVEVRTGTHNHGQGHETVFAQIIADRLGVPYESVGLVQGDTGTIPRGFGTHGSRSVIMAASLIANNAATILDRARAIAGARLEAAEEDLVYADGRFVVAGTNVSIGLFEIAGLCERAGEPPLQAESDFKLPDATYPCGVHVCEVEVDAETGAVRLDRFAAVDEVGRAINPMILFGQSHGGIAQGVGQALMECCRYDPETAQLLTASPLDYCLPRADDLPSIAVAIAEAPSPTNPLGVKGAGESGATGAPPAVINAVIDALRPLGVRHIDMPATPEAVWRAIGAARGG